MAKIEGVNIALETNLKNIIMNGDMNYGQRGSSFVAVANNTYTLDRWKYIKNGTMVHTITQDTDAPTISQVLAATGQAYLFTSSILLNLTTAQTSIAAGNFAMFSQFVEGFNFAPLAQKKTVISFWVKATATGVYCVSAGNSAGDRSYVGEYTINTTNTWEYKTVNLVASPSAGTWNYTTGIGIQISFALASGSTFNTTAGAWQTGNFIATANQVNGVNTGATNFRVTGVMMNEGVVAAPFRLFANSVEEEMACCQRYYEVITAGAGSLGFNQTAGSATVALWNPWKVTKRISPTTTVGTGGTQQAGIDGITTFQNAVGSGAYYSHGGITANADF